MIYRNGTCGRDWVKAIKLLNFRWVFYFCYCIYFICLYIRRENSRWRFYRCLEKHTDLLTYFRELGEWHGLAVSIEACHSKGREIKSRSFSLYNGKKVSSFWANIPSERVVVTGSKTLPGSYLHFRAGAGQVVITID